MEEIINKLKDLNARADGLYSIKITPNGFLHLKNYENTMLVTEYVQELREEMYRIILKSGR